MCRFFVVGDVTVDQMYFVSDLPDPGGEATALRAVMEPGGAGGTIATLLARLGNDVRIATRVGTGPFSELALRNLRDAGVDVRMIQVDDRLQTSSVTLLITPDTQRTMISAVGASRYLDSAELAEGNVADCDALVMSAYSLVGASRYLDSAELAEGDVEDCDALVMSAYSLVGGPQREYAVRALEHARGGGLTTFIDMGSGAVNALRDRMISLVQEVDYLLMNEKELYTLTGESSISDAVSGLARHGIERLVVKVGEMGSIVITPELTELVDPFDIDGVVDSTGAGDYFTAAFAHAIMEGHDLLHAARIGNVAGALNTTRVGAQTMRFDLDTLLAHADAMAAVVG